MCECVAGAPRQGRKPEPHEACGEKCSYAENREISRRVAWIAELRASQFQCLENKRYKVDQHPKDPEPQPHSSA